MPASFGAYCAVGLQPPKGVQPNHCRNRLRSWVQDSAIIAIALPRMIRLMPSRKTSGGTDSPTSPTSCHHHHFHGCHLPPSFRLKIPMRSNHFQANMPCTLSSYFTHRMRTSLVRWLLMNLEANLAFHLHPYYMSPSVLYQHYPLSYLTHIDCKHMRTIHQNYPSVHYKIPFCVMPCPDLKNRFLDTYITLVHCL